MRPVSVLSDALSVRSDKKSAMRCRFAYVKWIHDVEDENQRLFESIARIPGGIGEQIAIAVRNSW